MSSSKASSDATGRSRPGSTPSASTTSSAPKRKKRARAARDSTSHSESQILEQLAAPPRDAQEAQFTLTTKQWNYLEELLRQVDEGIVLTNKQTAQQLRIRAATISVWNRDPRFRRLAAKLIRETNEPLFELAVRAATRRAMAGSPKHLEGLLRARGLWDTYPAESGAGAIAVGAGATDAAVAVVGAVRFYGLPAPPTPAEAERLRPPIGSNAIIPAPKLPAAPGGR